MYGNGGRGRPPCTPGASDGRFRYSFVERPGAFSCALAAAAAASGLDFLTGRVPVLFYAQMGRAAWLGMLCTGLLLALSTAGLASLSMRSGARSLKQLFGRLPGGGAGRGMLLMLDLFLAAAAFVLVDTAGHIGELVLPVHRARIWAAVIAVLAAWSLACSGKGAMCAAGRLLAAAAVLFQAALLLFGRLPREPRLHWELELKLENSYPAAALFALLHGALCLCLTAGMSVRLGGGRTRPWRLGVWTGICFAALTALGNAVLMRGADELLALKLPFVALAGGWGSTGFFVSAALIYAAAAYALAGIIYGRILPHRRADFDRKMMLNYEKSREFN